MSPASQLHSSRQSNLPIMQWLVMLSGEFHNFPQPKLSPAAECLLQNFVIPSLAIRKIGKYHRKIPKSLLKLRADRSIFIGLFAFYNQIISECLFLCFFLSLSFYSGLVAICFQVYKENQN